ncbi:molybdopterin molybdotransferase MoeA [Shewanella salipaludis]|uniref:Molybdopterin molybdenumtransferase n=1 Tax=Shewanella salipaludis TaxID=2723052 RepID=A0A972FVT6_9GAMM|nr:molybdopterin molybdotransferase MoeA [Shewanella salipaludis]NMH66184.1 molybdopterin molybdotransferase MoeA [Shewanella salipaludis]
MPTDPCAQPSLMHPDQALPLLLERVQPLTETQVLPLAQALGRVLAEDQAATIDLPPFDNASMDGYAFRFDDLVHSQGQQEASLTLVGSAFAGHPYAGTCPRGTCIRIMTGAPLPPELDTVQMQELIRVEGEWIRIEAPHARGANVRRRGEEVAAGTQVLNAGTRINAAEMGVLATIGVARVRVYRRLTVAFFSTGDELRPLGSPLAAGQIYDSNRYAIQGLLSRADVDWLDLGVVADEPEALRQAFRSAAAQADMVLTSGGVSVGAADYTKQILEEEGKISFWKLAIKPGKPFAMGQIGDAIFCGLPGNPVSSMVTFYKLVWPLLNKMQGLTQTLPLLLDATLKSQIRKQAGRVEYQRGILSRNATGELEVTVTGAQGSGMLTSMSLANCFIILAQEQGDTPIGARVRVEPFNSVLC